jgi:hypothetical protein
MKKIKDAQDEILKALQDAWYCGERAVFEKGELKAAVVSIEDLEILEEMDRSDFQVTYQ